MKMGSEEIYENLFNLSIIINIWSDKLEIETKGNANERKRINWCIQCYYVETDRLKDAFSFEKKLNDLLWILCEIWCATT